MIFSCEVFLRLEKALHTIMDFPNVISGKR